MFLFFFVSRSNFYFIKEPFVKFNQWDKEVLDSPFGSPSPDDGVISSGEVGAGRTAGGLIGFIITCLMVLICLCFMIPLCIRWIFVTVRKLVKSKM